MEKGPKELEGKKYPAKAHALKVKKNFLSLSGIEEQSTANVSVCLTGEDLKLFAYSDQTKPFRQNRYFYYLSGVNIPGCHIVFNFNTEKLVLYLPEVDYDDIMWSGLPVSIEQALETFDVDEVYYVSDLQKHLTSMEGFRILTSDFNERNDQFKSSMVEKDDTFFKALDESRLIKDDYEVALMRHAAKITDNCHFAVMSALPIESNEGHIHAEFTYHAIRQGSKNQAYDPICCSGPNCSTLHYVKNDDEFKEADKKSILIDAGAEWSNYASDVTRCFPISGKWTKEHREIYDAVLDMQKQTMDLIKPGQSWDELHILAHKILIKHFLKLGIFKDSFSEEEIFSKGLSVPFFPHGLGHLLGMDTHDVGGYADYEDPNPMLRYLRLRRPLQQGMVVTDEPGCYFSPFLLEETLKSDDKMRYINKEVLDKYWYIGGVRIEDDILVTESGYDNFTGITSDPEQIEKIVCDGISKGRDYFHNVI